MPEQKGKESEERQDEKHYEQSSQLPKHGCCQVVVLLK